MARPLEVPRQPVVHGPPLHAMLSALPATLIPAALLAEAWRAMSTTSERRLLSDAATGAAIAGAAAAATVGWIDWLTMPAEHPVQKPATWHRLINSGPLLALIGAATSPAPRLPFLATATAALVVGGWIGGERV